MGIPKTSNRDQSLDVVRGVAILLAMGWHFNAQTGVTFFDALLEPGRRFGWAGVDLFFVLSGFLIGGLVLREREKTGGFDANEFLLRRAIRLWPVVWVFLVAQLVLSDKPWNTFLFQNLLHVQNFWISSISHLWSLAVEEHFYLLLAVTLLLTAGVGKLQKPLLIGLLFILVATPFLRWGAFSAGVSHQVIQWQTQYRVDALACGVLLALIKQSWPLIFDRIKGARVILAAALIVCVSFVAFVPRDGVLGSVLGFTLAYIGSASFLLLVYRSALVSRWHYLFSPLSMIGLYSYSMYVWHMAASNLAVKAGVRVGLHSPALIVLAKYAAAIGVAIIMFYLVERPAMLLRERLAPAKSHIPV